MNLVIFYNDDLDPYLVLRIKANKVLIEKALNFSFQIMYISVCEFFGHFEDFQIDLLESNFDAICKLLAATFLYSSGV